MNVNLQEYSVREPFLIDKNFYSKILHIAPTIQCKFKGTDVVTVIYTNHNVNHFKRNDAKGNLKNVYVILSSTFVHVEHRNYIVIDDLLYYQENKKGYDMTYRDGGYKFDQRIGFIKDKIMPILEKQKEKYVLNYPVFNHNWHTSYKFYDWVREWLHHNNPQRNDFLYPYAIGLIFRKPDFMYDKKNKYTFGNYLHLQPENVFITV